MRREGRSPLPTLVHIRVHPCPYLFRYTGYMVYTVVYNFLQSGRRRDKLTAQCPPLYTPYLFRYTGYTYCSAHPCIHHTSGTCLFRLLWWHEFRLFFLKKCPVKWVIAVVFKDISSLMCCSCSFKKKSSKMSFGCSFYWNIQ